MVFDARRSDAAQKDLRQSPVRPSLIYGAAALFTTATAIVAACLSGDSEPADAGETDIPVPAALAQSYDDSEVQTSVPAEERATESRTSRSVDYILSLVERNPSLFDIPPDEDVSREAYSNLSSLLAMGEEDVSSMPDLSLILEDPSHIRPDAEKGLTVIAKWFRHEYEDRTALELYALVVDGEDRLVTVHRYACSSFDVSHAVEVCMPQKSAFVDNGQQYSIRYFAGGVPSSPEPRGNPDFTLWSEDHQGYFPSSLALSMVAEGPRED